MEHRIVFVDVETGGTDPDEHQITQIAAVATSGFPHFEEIKEFERKIELVEGHYTLEALEVQGYDSMIWEAEAIPIGRALDAFKGFLFKHTHERISKKGRPYKVAHMGATNGDFDSGFLRASAERSDVWLPLTSWTGGIFDTLHLTKWVLALQGTMVPKNLQLATCCELMGCRGPDDFGGAHDALADCKASAELSRACVEYLQPPVGRMGT